MPLLKLTPAERARHLRVPEITKRLRKAFEVVETDKTRGWDHVDELIAQTLRSTEAAPLKQAQLEWLQSVQEDAVFVSFGNTPDRVASCCLLPKSDIYFHSAEEIQGALRPLVERCAVVLGYDVVEA